MKIEQAHISRNVRFFKDKFLKKYGLVEMHNSSSPLVMFGLYNENDYQILKAHKGFVIVVWCGSDGSRLTDARALLLKQQAHKIQHIVTHDFCAMDLKQKGIPNLSIPITPITERIAPVPLGNFIYHYGNGADNFYGDEYLPEIERRTGLHVIQTTKNTYDKETLLTKIYPKTFIGLRLTKHDGVPTTVIEMGMMGRKCIFNGSVPHNIRWKGIDDICENIMTEYEKRKDANYTQISQDVHAFVDVGTDWLKVDNYK